MEETCFGLKDHSPTRAQYLGRANFSFISLQNLVKRLHENRKLPRRMTRLSEFGLLKGLKTETDHNLRAHVSADVVRVAYFCSEV